MTATSTQEAVDKKKDEITAKLADIQTQFTITATAGEGGKIELKDEIKERAKDETSYETKAYKEHPKCSQSLLTRDIILKVLQWMRQT